MSDSSSSLREDLPDAALEDAAGACTAGSVRLNGAPSHGLGDVPFGGNGASGSNREGIHSTIEEMLRTKSIIL